MSYRQPKYIAPADANVAIEKFNESMKAFADEAKNQKQLEFCRENPGACEDDNREAEDSTNDKTSTKTTKALKPPMPKKQKPIGTKQLMTDDMEKFMIKQEPQFKK